MFWRTFFFLGNVMDYILIVTWNLKKMCFLAALGLHCCMAFSVVEHRL